MKEKTTSAQSLEKPKGLHREAQGLPQKPKGYHQKLKGYHQKLKGYHQKPKGYLRLTFINIHDILSKHRTIIKVAEQVFGWT